MQTSVVTLSGLNDGVSTAALSVPVSFLLGDANGDRVVNSADATMTRTQSGQPADAINFRSDFNLDGAINSADATMARSQSGNGLASANGPRSSLNELSAPVETAAILSDEFATLCSP